MHGALSTLTAIQAASVLSCFVWSEASDRGNPKIRDELQGAYGALREAAKRVGQAQSDAGMHSDLEGFVNSFRPDLMDMVTLWASGASFSEVR
jgi:ATP-dependent RNA helicase DOB1